MINLGLARFERVKERYSRGRIGWLDLALLALLVATAFNRYQFDIAGISLRPEHFVFGLALLVVGFETFRQRSLYLVLNLHELLLGLYLGLTVITSLINAPSWWESLKYCGIMILAVLLYFLVKNLALANPDRFLLAFKTLLGMGLAVAIYGLVAWLVFLIGPNIGVTLYRLGSGPADELSACTVSSQATLFEPNLYASFLVSLLLAGLVWFTSKKLTRRQFLFLTIVEIGIGVSLTRGAWVALAGGLSLVVVFVPARRQFVAIGLSLVVTLLAVTLLVANYQVPCRLEVSTVPGEGIVPVRVAGQISNGQITVDSTGQAASVPKVEDRVLSSPSINWRLDTFGRALEDWRSEPLLGLGANSYAQKYVTTSNTPGWISNMFLMALHDTGLIGLGLLVGWCVWLGWDIWQALKSTATDRRIRLGLKALSIALAGLLIAYQFSSAFWLGFTWVILGMVVAALYLLDYRRGGQKVLFELRLGWEKFPAPQPGPETELPGDIKQDKESILGKA